MFNNPSGRQLQGKSWVNRPIEPGEVRRSHVRRSGLTLWIGWTPAQANDRYPNGDSNKCKLRECAFDSRSIKTGDPRVVFDERCNEKGDAVDPYYNAAYCHLYCVEKHFNLMQLAHVLDVRLDDRNLDKEERNLSALKPEEYDTCRKWFESSWPRYRKWYNSEYIPAKDRREAARKYSPSAAVPAPAVEDFREWEHSLTSSLMEKSIELESKGKASQRKRRRIVKPDSCDRDMHRGDLDFANAARHKRATQGVGYVWDDFQREKRKRQEENWESFYPGLKPQDISGPGQQMGPLCQPPHWIIESTLSSRPGKRSRLSDDESGPGAEPSRPTKRPRHQASNGMAIIEEHPSRIWTPETAPYAELPKMEPLDYSAGMQYASELLVDGTGFAYQPPYEMPGMHPFSAMNPEQLQNLGPDTVDAVMADGTSLNPDMSLYNFTSQDDAMGFKEEDEENGGGGEPEIKESCNDSSSELYKIPEYKAPEEVKAQGAADFYSFINQEDSPPLSPGKRRKRDDDNEEDGGKGEQHDIKRRCSESSR
ncbi:hypothetical protein PG994_011752 [Apiospora phragmitis]|uniref:Uncharacterized protein n=1 Tax=Apiospora phragmitis TaxID=2905665 RepID=A0ABR1TTW7_9PEZI